MGAAAAGVLLRRAIRRAFRAVCNLLVLLVLLILVLCNKLQGRVLQQSRHSAVRVLLLLSMLRKHRCAIRQTPMPACTALVDSFTASPPMHQSRVQRLKQTYVSGLSPPPRGSQASGPRSGERPRPSA